MKDSELLVYKYKPTTYTQFIGHQGDNSCLNRLTKWLSTWQKNINKKPGHDKLGSLNGAGFKAALLSGGPGIGKTTAAYLVCKNLDFDFCEMNASDSRNKNSLDEMVKELLNNWKLTNFFDKKRKKLTSKHVLIMDEIDGMSGNGDRGGIKELISMIKTTKVPIICICNNLSHPKVRSLSNYCYDLRFYKPNITQIKGKMMSIAYQEGIKISSKALHELIVFSNHDIRQILNNLSFLGTSCKPIENMINNQSIKDVRFGPFDAIRKVFTSGNEYDQMSFQDKSNLFYCDYSIMPLFVFENYINVIPKERDYFKLASKAIDAIGYGDIIDQEIRSNNNWSLLPLQAAFSSIMPGAYMNGYVGQTINFPSFFGKLSITNKKDRQLQELKMHMNLKVSGNKNAINLDYLEPLREKICCPLEKNGKDGISQVIDTLNKYSLRREDIDSIIELTLWDKQTNPMDKLDRKTKTALTKTYNKKGITLPYSLGSVKKAKINEKSETYNNQTEENDTNDDTQEDNDSIDIEEMIKVKKKKNKIQSRNLKRPGPKNTKIKCNAKTKKKK